MTKHDHDLFLQCPSHDLLVSFIFNLSDAVVDTTISSVKAETQHGIVTKILDILRRIHLLLDECPPEDANGSRFGNKSFRTFLARVDAAQLDWHTRLGITDSTAIDEVSTYLRHAFGNATRIDYGSGHELNFFMWLLCLNRLSLLPPHTFQQVALIVFKRYLDVMRAVQTTYYLEPAGSHGVWGLDDYQFIPFLFGASQLLNHPHLRPLSIHQTAILEQCAPDYLYLDQIAFINSVKNVKGLRWHSPMLDDISSAKSWQKVSAGMRKMFLAEVIGKLPVMQHFLFGSIISAAPGMSAASADSDENDLPNASVVMADGMKHVHAETGWGDCCGIKVPSTIGAAVEGRKGLPEQTLRRLPFD